MCTGCDDLVLQIERFSRLLKMNSALPEADLAGEYLLKLREQLQQTRGSHKNHMGS
jgi:hypothetical protein